MKEPICASCRFFYPCPCGECSYGICGNTESSWLHEYVYEDMSHCQTYSQMSDEAKRAWAELSGEGADE